MLLVVAVLLRLLTCIPFALFLPFLLSGYAHARTCYFYFFFVTESADLCVFVCVRVFLFVCGIFSPAKGFFVGVLFLVTRMGRVNSAIIRLEHCRAFAFFGCFRGKNPL